LNNWKAIGYIFLGFGSIFLGYALIAFFAITSFSNSFINLAFVALAANAPWFILAALSYVVGVVGYFAGREKSTIDETDDYEVEYIAYKFDPLWSVVIGALVTIALLVLQGVMGFWNDFDLIYGVALPFFYSIVAGSAVGFSVFYLIKRVNRN
jgi:hypothetical protein